jgi:hypothetical protein
LILGAGSSLVSIEASESFGGEESICVAEGLFKKLWRANLHTGLPEWFPIVNIMFHVNALNEQLCSLSEL